MTDKSEATLPLEHEPIKTSVEMVNVTPAEMTTTEGPDISRLMEIALQQGEGGVGALEKLVALQERMEDREARKAFMAAMLGFQNACPTIRKTTGGYKDTYKFAPLEYVVKTIAPHLEAHGLTFAWENATTAPDNMIRIVTIIRHVQGHSERYTGPLFPCQTKTPAMGPQQIVGATESYAKRYGLLSALGITTGGEDNDAAPGADEFLTDKQANEIHAKVDEIGLNKDRYLKHLGVDQIGHLPQSRFRQVMNALNKRAEDAK